VFRLKSERVAIQLGCRRDLLQRLFQFLRLEPERPGLALVNHAVVSVDQVNTLRPSGVRALGLVVESIDHRRKLDTQLSYTCSRDLAAFLIIFRTCEKNFVLQVALRLPDVGGMRLRDVDNQERDLLSVLIVELVERGNLPPERRSSIAAEKQHDRLRSRQRRELYGGGFVELPQGEVGRHVTSLQMSRTSTRPHRFKRNKEIRDHGHALHHPAERLRRLMHGPPDVAGEYGI
jgi:hypothetical protein